MPRVPFPVADFPKNRCGEITVEATFTGQLARKLVEAALARNQHPNDMLSALVHAAVETWFAYLDLALVVVAGVKGGESVRD